MVKVEAEPSTVRDVDVSRPPKAPKTSEGHGSGIIKSGGWVERLQVVDLAGCRA
jgi:hypothetical protein